MDFLHQEIFGGYTILDVIIAAAVILLLLSVARKIFGKSAPEVTYMQQGTCESCGWSGKASKHTRRCPKCNGDVRISG